MTTKTIPEPLAIAIKSAKLDAKATIRNMKTRIKSMETWADTVAMWQEMVAEHHTDINGLCMQVSGGAQSFIPGVQLTIQVKNISEIAPILRELAKRGHHKPMLLNLESSQSLCYRYPGFDLDLCFYGDDSDSSACRYVQTGVTEEPVYELRCGGSALGKEEVLSDTMAHPQEA